MRAETVKRMILLSVENPTEDLEELLELYARLWSRENGQGREPLRAAESVPNPPENVTEGTERVIEPAESVIEPAEAVSEEPPQGEEEPSKDGNAILGFAHIRCEHCGAEKTFCAKGWISKYTCDRCGQVTRLRGHVHPAKATCKCGNKSIYSTNVEESAFDIPCVVCGAPMSVVWTPGKNRYEPAGGEPEWRRRRKKK